MNLRNKLKKFFTLNPRHEAGFTLVELIVVIAILAILGGVGTAAYSGYIKKANMTADKTLVNDIIRAVELYSYSEDFPTNIDDGVIGYVVLTNDENVEAVANDTLTSDDGSATNHLNNALVDAFGSDWATSLNLSYNGWADAATMLNQVANNKYAGSVNGSTYITDVGTEKLLGDVQNCAGSLAEFLVGIGWGGTDGAEALEGMIGTGAVSTLLNGYDDDEITGDVLANATVFGIASTMTSDADANEIISNFATGYYIYRNWNSAGNPIGYSPLTNISGNTNILTEVAHTYAAMEAFVGYMDDAELNNIFAGIDMSGNKLQIIASVRDACHNMVECINANAALVEKGQVYIVNGQAKKDGEAYVGIMQSVNNLGSSYSEDLSNPDMFSTSDMANSVNSYVAAASLKEVLDSLGSDALLSKVAANTYESAVVLIFTIDENGILGYTVCPANAWHK